jgi:hypothetical protein
VANFLRERRFKMINTPTHQLLVILLWPKIQDDQMGVCESFEHLDHLAARADSNRG